MSRHEASVVLTTPPIPDNVRSVESHRTPRFGIWTVAGTILVVASALALVGYYLWNIEHRTMVAPVAVEPAEGAVAPAEAQFGPSIGEEIRILAGANRSFVDRAGKLWVADVWSTGRSALKSPVQHIWRTLDPDFYRTSRQGNFRYDIPLRRGIYELRLHFAETTFGPESTDTGGEGNRLMTVRANGTQILTRFDIAADAGASRRPM